MERYWWLALGAIAVGSSPEGAIAQLIPDATLGAESSQVIPNATVHGLPADLIQGGALRGSNLFHSFQDFNVGALQRVYFANPDSITNIFSRVTGGNPSNILGTLGVDGGANLFLLNPNGILFGPNARLDIAGSFFASTADRWVFENGLEFSATNPEAPSPLLTVNVTPGLQYGTANQASIASQGTLVTGGDLTLQAGHLELQGHLQAGGHLTLEALETLRIRDTETAPFVAVAGGNLLVQGNEQVDIFALNHPDSGFYAGGDLMLRSSNAVGGDAHYWSGGSFRVEQLDGELGDLHSPYDPIIRASGDVLISAYRGASLHILAGGAVTIPQYIWITGADPTYALVEAVPLSDGSVFSINGKIEPTVDIRAGVNPLLTVGPTLEGTGTFFAPSGTTTIPSSATIRVGTIFFNDFTSNQKGDVLLTNQYEPNYSLSGDIEVNPTLPAVFPGSAIVTGDAFQGGEIVLDSRSSVRVNGNLAASALAFSGNYFGNGGNIKILAQEDTRINGIVTSRGLLSGSISLDTGAGLFINNSILTETHGNTTSTSGDLSLQGDTISVNNGALVGTATFGDSNAGNISVETRIFSINGTDLSETTPSAIFSNSQSGAGNAGDLTVNVDYLSITNGGRLASISRASGNSGAVIINAKDRIEVSGTSDNELFFSNIRTDQLTPGAAGNSGEIIINTDELVIRDGGQVASGTFGSGRGGLIRINALESIEIYGESNLGERSALFSKTADTGDAGNIEIFSNRFSLGGGAILSAETSGIGNAGNITISSQNLVLSGIGTNGPTQIRSDARPGSFGRAGDLAINTDHLEVLDGAQIVAGTFGTGRAGNIFINASQRLTINNLGFIASSTSGQGDAGHISINALNLVANQSSFITASAFSKDSGQAGNLSINATNLSILGGSQVQTSTSGPGNGGSLQVNVTGILELTGRSSRMRDRKGNLAASGLFTNTLGYGNAGDLRIEAYDLSIRDGAGIAALTDGKGAAGDIHINARSSVALSSATEHRSSISFDSRGSGNAGLLTLSTPYLALQNGGQILGSTTGSGNAGEIQIDTNRLMVSDGGQIIATTSGTGRGGILSVSADAIEIDGTNGNFASGLYFDSRGAGDAGQLSINAGQLRVRNGGQVSASTSNQGRGGILSVNADAIEIDGTNGNFASGLYFDSRGAGDARGIIINTGRLAVENGGTVTVSGSGSGRSGDLEVNAGSIFLNNQGSLRATTSASEGGNINLRVARDINLRHNSEISAEAFGASNGGNIRMEAGGFIWAVLPENSDIVANAYEGEGGTIYARAQGVFGFRQFRDRRTDESDFTASSALGIDGSVTIESASVQPDTPLPTQFSEAPPVEGCYVSNTTDPDSTAPSSFQVTGSGGIAPGPDEVPGSAVATPWTDLDDGELEREAAAVPATPPSVEADGWQRLPDGRLMPTASEEAHRVSNCYPLDVAAPNASH